MRTHEDLRTRLEKRIERIPFTSCWIWTGRTLASNGAPMLCLKNARKEIFKIFRGSLTKGNRVLKMTCGDALCVNPDHMRFDDLQLAIEEADKSTGCWVVKNRKLVAFGYAYGCFNRKGMGLHRASFLRHKCEIPKGMCVCHKCDVPACINPDHLFLGTYKENNHDAIRKGRIMIGANHRFGKFSSEKIEEVKSLLKTGITGADVARKTGVSETQVYRIRDGNARVAL